MILPSGFEYPFSLRSKKDEIFLFDVAKKGFLKIVIKQCDNGDAKFSYTDKYELFKQKLYSVENSLKPSDSQEIVIYV